MCRGSSKSFSKGKHAYVSRKQGTLYRIPDPWSLNPEPFFSGFQKLFFTECLINTRLFLRDVALAFFLNRFKEMHRLPMLTLVRQNDTLTLVD